MGTKCCRYPRLFVLTHCGWGGLCESLAAGKPIVAAPFRLDQPGNAKKLRELGCAEELRVRRMTAKDVTRAVAKVLEEPKYAENVMKLQTALLLTGGSERCAEVV